MSYTTSLTFKLVRDDDSEIVLELDVRGTFGSPGYTTGPPEDCYPPEPGEIEEVTATCDGVDFDLSTLSPTETARLDTPLIVPSRVRAAMTSESDTG